MVNDEHFRRKIHSRKSTILRTYSTIKSKAGDRDSRKGEKLICFERAEDTRKIERAQDFALCDLPNFVQVAQLEKARMQGVVCGGPVGAASFVS